MLGRPQETEAAPYYFTHINQVTGDDPFAVINSQLRHSLEIFSGFPVNSRCTGMLPQNEAFENC